jgi:apolipoprotein N-acyltransferase
VATLTSRITKAWPIAASVAMLLAAFPPFNLALLVFVALAPWLVSLKGASNWGAFRSGYLFGLLYMLGQMAWLQSLTNHWVHNFGLSLVPWFLSALVAGFYFAAAGWLIRLCWNQNRPWLIPIAWVGIEVFRSFIPGLAFPWGLIATPLWPMPILIQTAFYGTIYLVSAWVVLANVTVALILAELQYQVLLSYVTVWVVLLAVSLVRYTDEPKGQTVPVVIGQPGVDMAFGDPVLREANLERNLAKLFVQAKAQRPRLFVLPEGLTRPTDTLPPPVPFEIPEGLPVLFGGQRGSEPVYQSAFSYDGKWRYADKMRLVVFGEYVPGRKWIPFLDRFDLPSGDLTPSSKVSAIEVGGLRVGPLLCFEGLFADVAQRQVENGAQMLAVMAVDDWYVGTAAPAQLKCGAIWRAVETGLPVARSATRGYTLAADARGNVLAEAPFGELAALCVKLTVPVKPDRMPIRPFVPWVLLLSCPVIWILDRFWRKAPEVEVVVVGKKGRKKR